MNDNQFYEFYQVLVRIARALEGKSSTCFQKLGKESVENIGLDIINWLVGGGQNKRPAEPEDGFAWAYIYDRDGNVYPELQDLFIEVSRTGKVQVNGYEISLGGTKNQLLNRRIIKK